MKRKQKPKPAVEKGLAIYPRDSDEARAIRTLHDIVGRTRAFFIIFHRVDGVSFTKPMTLQLTAFSQTPQQSEWVTLTYAQAGSWEQFLRGIFDGGQVRQRLREGSRAPWPWPPSIEGKVYADAGGPPPLTSDDLDAFANEGQ